MKNSERDNLKAEKIELTLIFQGMLGYLKIANESFNIHHLQVKTKSEVGFDWQQFEDATKEARDVQSEANEITERIWQIEHTLMDNPNYKEVRTQAGGIFGAKIRASKLEKTIQSELANNQVALQEWDLRIQKVRELRQNEEGT